MCGIAGWLERSGEAVERATLERMAEAIAHRGPDDGGIWLDGPIGLAHRRLSIRDLSAAGRQPMADEGRRVFVTYNGEIYNDAPLRRELERDFGVRFRTSCDTEILPYAYLAWGEAMFERLEGMFALALWDRRSQRLVLARDAIGIKPLYLAADNGTVLFASEVKGILAAESGERPVDPAALHTFLASGHPGTRASLLEGIEQVGPGQAIVFSPEGRSDRQFWAPARTGAIRDMEEALALASETLQAVVADQLVSDVPLGILQSGGIDSSLVSLAASRLGARPPVFTASFEEASHDETADAGLVAEAASLEQRVVPVEALEDTRAAWSAVVHYFDGQCADGGALASFRLSQAVRRHSTVALSGDGGDEFFCGYETYSATRLASWIEPAVPRGLARALARRLYGMAPANEDRLATTTAAARFLLGLADPARRPHLAWRRLVPFFLAGQLYGPAMRELADSSPYDEYAAHYDRADGDVLDAAMLADQRFHLQSVLAKVDAMSMAHALEIRVPLLDRRMMELAGRIDLRLLHPRLGPQKLLLRRLAERMGAPAAVAWAKKKGFNVPIARLLRTELRASAEDLLERQADVLAPHLQPDRVRALWREHRDRRANHAYALWPILTLATWRAGLARPLPLRAAPAQPILEPSPGHATVA